MLLELKRLQGAKRTDLIDGHLVRVYPFVERLPMMHRDGWEGPRIGSSAIPMAWFVFDRDPERPGVIETRRISWRALCEERGIAR